jgi:hypothetical protein
VTFETVDEAAAEGVRQLVECCREVVSCADDRDDDGLVAALLDLGDLLDKLQRLAFIKGPG